MKDIKTNIKIVMESNNVIKFKKKDFYNIELNSFEATNIISEQKKYRVHIEEQLLFEKYLGEKRTHKDFLKSLPKLDKDVRNFLVVSYYLLWNWLYTDLKELSETLYDNGLDANFDFVLNSEQNRKIYHYLFPLKVITCQKNTDQINLF